LADRSHLSIGEVLSLLQEEFPDITISKIRFLESQGLVDPERTPSGYRKFYEQDIERLRWVLRQQRDAFLPLKVIKGRLEGQGRLALGEPGLGLHGAVVPASPADNAPPAGRAAVGGAPAGRTGPGTPSQSLRAGSGERAEEPGEALGSAPGVAGAQVPTGPAPIRGSGAGEGLGPSASDSGPPSSAGPTSAAEPAGPTLAGPNKLPGGAGPTRADKPSASRRQRGPRLQAAMSPANEPTPAGRGEGPALVGPAGDELSEEELAQASGVGREMLSDLERYGLITPRMVGGAPYYSQDDVAVARLAVAFARHGVEARHLRAYKGAAEREAGMVQQVVMPLIRQRNPEARRAASRAVDELSALGGELRAVLLREALADLH